MSLDERLELVEYIERTVDSAPIEVTEEQKAYRRALLSDSRTWPCTSLATTGLSRSPSRLFVLRNQRRTTLMLGQVRLHLNGTDDIRRYAHLLRTWLTDRHGVGLPHQAVTTPEPSSSSTGRTALCPRCGGIWVCPDPEPHAHADERRRCLNDRVPGGRTMRTTILA